MEEFKKFLGMAYFYEDNKDAIPANVAEKINKEISIDYTSEKFICVTWVKAAFSMVPYFVVVTNKRVVAKVSGKLEQNSFKDVTGVEKNDRQNIVIRSAGNTTFLFEEKATPSKDLLAKLLPILNKAWLDSKHSPAETGNQGVDIAGQIEKLSKLKDSGILTEAEFSEKKKELLAKM